MATRSLKFAEWLRLVKRHALDNQFANVSGYPVLDVASKLDVHRSRIYQLIENGTLDTIEITGPSGKVALTLVTEASLDRYLADRVPDRNRQGYFAFQA